MKKLLFAIISVAFLISLYGCAGYVDSHRSSDISRSANIPLENNFETVGSIKPQTDKLAKDISEKISLKEVIAYLPDGSFDKGTVHFIYYGEINNSATKVTYTIDIEAQKIVNSRVQKGSPNEVGAIPEVIDINNSLNIKTTCQDIYNGDAFKNALTREFGGTEFDSTKIFMLEIDFFAGIVNIRASSDEKIFYETTITPTNI